jgi:hypothetical protein
LFAGRLMPDLQAPPIEGHRAHGRVLPMVQHDTLSTPSSLVNQPQS